MTFYPSSQDVPPPPTNAMFDDHLRWAVFVMDRDDPQRHFAASCLAWVLKSGGLSERQAAACVRLLARIRELYGAGALECQAAPQAELTATTRKGLH